LIAAPAQRDHAYEHGKLRVARFAASERVSNRRDLYGEGDRGAAERFSALIESARPDLVHLHAFTPSVSLRVLREATHRRVPVIFTYHTPTVSCQRGTLLQWGHAICDGRLDVARCAGCTLHKHGLPTPLSAVLGRLPPASGRALGRLGLAGGAWTVLRMSELVELRHTTFHAFMAEADLIVALCGWSRAFASA
jgi:hypothetical protein